MHPARGSIKRVKGEGEREMEMGSISNFCPTCKSSQDANFFLLFCDIMHEVARLFCHIRAIFCNLLICQGASVYDVCTGKGYPMNRFFKEASKGRLRENADKERVMKSKNQKILQTSYVQR